MPRPLFARGRQGSGDSSDNAYEGSEASVGGYSNRQEGVRAASPAMSSLSAAAADFSSGSATVGAGISRGPPAPPPQDAGPRLFRYIGPNQGPPQQQQGPPNLLQQRQQQLPPPQHLQQQQGPPNLQHQLSSLSSQGPPPPQQQQIRGQGQLPPHLLQPLPPPPAQHQQQPPQQQRMEMPMNLSGHGYPGSADAGPPPEEGIIGVSAAMDPLDSVLGPFPCARLRGLPIQASLEDVMLFFAGLVILDIVVLNPQAHAKGQGQGEAFVVFANPMDFQMALQRDKGRIGSAQIHVFQGKRADYYSAIAAKSQERGYGQGGGMPLVSADTVGMTGMNSASFGQYGGSTLQQAAGMSMPPMDNLSLGGGMGGSGGVDMLQGIHGVHGVMPPQGARPGQNRPTSRGGGIREGEHTGFLRMRGLPFSATRQEIIDFFQDFDPLEDSVCLTCRSDGRATGEAYVAFNSPDDAKKAMGLHRSTMGSRYIELFISNKDEHARAMSRTNNR